MPEVISSCSLVWAGLAPPRVKAFYWLAVSGKISTVDNLRRRGIFSDAIANICHLRGKEVKSVNHLFLHCKFSSSLWCLFLKQSGVWLCFPKTLEGMEESWRHSPFFGYGLVLWRLSPFVILRSN